MAVAVSVRFDFVDDKGKSSFTKVRVPNGYTLAGYTNFASSMAQLMANVSNARITNVSYCVSLDLSGAVIKGAASGLSDIAQKMLFGFSTAVAGLRTKMKIPAISELKVISGSDAINLADPDVGAYLAAMENGIAVTLGTISPTDMRQNDITTTDYAREIFRSK